MLEVDLNQQRIKVIAKREFGKDVREHMKKELESFLGLYDQKFGPDSLKEFRITIKEMHKGGKREEFEIQATLFTERGDFHAKREGWDLIEIFGEIIKATKRQIRM